MITLITGTPGAGKTLYCISSLLRELVDSVVAGVDSSGQAIEVKRVIYTNINGLLIDHELIDGRDGGGLADWHKWARPGAVICFDEVQKQWPPRANGSKVPEFISALETHRHMGVDFIILTQNPMLLDQNVRALVGRHIHVRRLGAANFALTYEWDHCNRSLAYSKALKKSPMKYDKSVFKLYKSSELHTKPKSSVPPLIYVVGLAFVGVLVLVPQVYSRLAGHSVPAVQSKPVPPAIDQPPGTRPVASDGQGIKPGAYDWAAFVPRVSYQPWTAPAYDNLRQVVAMPRIVASMCVNDDCKCLSQQTTVVLRGADCLDWIQNRPFDPYLPDPDRQASAALQQLNSSSQSVKSGIPALPVPDVFK